MKVSAEIKISFVVFLLFLIFAAVVLRFKNLQAESYATIPIVIHGKKLLGTGPYKEAVEGEVLALEDSCCIEDYRNHRSLTVLDQKEFQKAYQFPKKITVKTRGKIHSYHVDPDALILTNGRQASSLRGSIMFFYPECSSTDVPMIRNEIKDFYVDTYILLDKNNKAKYIEMFPVVGIIANLGKPFTLKYSGNIIITDLMGIRPYDCNDNQKAKVKKTITKDATTTVVLKPSSEKQHPKKKKVYKFSLSKNCIITKNYLPASTEALASIDIANVLFDQHGRAKHVDIFKTELVDCPPTVTGTPLNLLGKYGKEAYITDRTKIFWYGWQIDYTEYKRIENTWCCGYFSSICKNSKEVKSIVLYADD